MARKILQNAGNVCLECGAKTNHSTQDSLRQRLLLSDEFMWEIRDISERLDLAGRGRESKKKHHKTRTIISLVAYDVCLIYTFKLEKPYIF